jgi:hypothetical protein
MLYFEHPLMVHDTARGAREMSKIVGCTPRHIYYLCERTKFPYETDGSSTLQLRRSVYFAWLFAQAQKHGGWDLEETAMVEMNLAVHRAGALMRQLSARQRTVSALNAEELVCYAGVMGAAVTAADKVLILKAG